MSVTIDLPDDTLRRLEGEAARRGVTIDELIAVLAAALPSDSEARRSPAFVAVGASAHGITDRVGDILTEGFGRD